MAGILDQYLEDWYKGAQRANKDAESYNNTLMMGSDGKPIGEKNGYLSPNAPKNFIVPYGMLTPSPKDPTVNMVRQNPTGTTNDTRQYFAQTQDDDGTVRYLLGDGSDGYRYNASKDEYGNVVAMYGSNGETSSLHAVRQWENGQYGTGDVTYQFPDQPQAFTKKKPTFTAAQEAQLGQPTDDVAMSDMERGGNGIISRLLERKNEQD